MIILLRFVSPPDIECDELYNDSQVDELTEDGSLGNEDPGVADIGKQRRNVTQTDSNRISTTTFLIKGRLILNFIKVQCTLHNVITLGPRETDNINRSIDTYYLGNERIGTWSL